MNCMVVDNGKTVATMASRSLKQYQKEGIIQRLTVHIVTKIIKQYPQLNTLAWASVKYEHLYGEVPKYGQIAKEMVGGF